MCHFFSILGLWALDRRRKRQAAEIARRARISRLEGSVDDEEEVVFDAEAPSLSRRGGSLHAKEESGESLMLRSREGSSSTLASSGSAIAPPSGEPQVDDGVARDVEEEPSNTRHTRRLLRRPAKRPLPRLV